MANLHHFAENLIYRPNKTIYENETKTANGSLLRISNVEIVKIIIIPYCEVNFIAWVVLNLPNNNITTI